jgi:hypothetical protein
MKSETVSVGGDIATLSDLQVVDKGRGKCWHIGTMLQLFVDTNAAVFDKGSGYTLDSEAPSSLEYDTCTKF